MPPLTLVAQQASLAARKLFETGNDHPPGPLIPASAIVTLVFFCIVPVIILAIVVIWLLAFYGRDKACCPCCIRKRRAAKRAAKRAMESPNSSQITTLSEQIPMETLPSVTEVPEKVMNDRTGVEGHVRMHSGGTGSSSLGVVRETRVFI